MGKYVCGICGYTYDEAQGVPGSGIPPGTPWEEVREDWLCPLCGAGKSDFKPQGGSAVAISSAGSPVAGAPSGAGQKLGDAARSEHDTRELSPLEMSALCTNLARGCEKQYQADASVLFAQLAAFFRQKAAPAEAPDFQQILALIDGDLKQGLPEANAAAAAVKDRGALRALVWNEKVTRILKSILARYLNEGDAMLEHTGVYVCTICGFLYIGDTLPDLCPVCKVPNWKFEKIEGRVSNG